MTNIFILRRDGRYYVQGRKSSYDPTRDRMLLCHGSYPECETPEVGDPDDARRMHSALYDHLQCENGYVDGDTFVTPHGLFVVRGVHVEPIVETKAEAKARRARVRRAERAYAAAEVDATSPRRGVNFDNGAGGSH